MNTQASSISAGSTLKFKLMGILILLISSGFVWMATDQVIAPPILRMADLFWRLFICRCFFQFDIL